MSVAVTAAFVGAGVAAHNARVASEDASKARKTTKNWRHRALDEEERQFDLGREDLAPYRELGYNAIANLEDPDAYTKAPGYQFRLDEGNRAAENLFSSKGGGGNAMKALAEYNQNFASNDYYNYRNDQRANAGLGQSATNLGVMSGANSGRTRAGIYQSSGQDLASIGMWGGYNKNNALTSGISNLLYGIKTANAAKKPSSTYTGR